MNKNINSIINRLYDLACPFSDKKVKRIMSQQEKLRHVEQHFKSLKTKLKSVPSATNSEIYEYECWRRSRQINKIEKLPNFEREKINSALLDVLNKYPNIEKVYLTGSYVTGEFINEFLPVYWWNLKKKVKGKAKISDVDFVTFPLILEKGKTFDLIPDERKEKILIYEKK